MPSVVLLNQIGQEIDKLQLSEEVFGVETHQQAIFDTIVAERAGMRQGTQKAKTRAEVSGGGRKPWRQKGTGRARQGSIRSPQWRGGGVAFAPVPRSHALKVNKKVVRLATKCALSAKVREKNLIALDTIDLADFKTKSLIKVLDDIKAEGKILIVVPDTNQNLELAGRNLPYAIIQKANRVSVYQLMNASNLVITKEAIAYFEEVLK